MAVPAAVVLGWLCSRVADWAVMTDELLYERLALSFADGALLPTLRGEHVDVYAPLYPVLLAPVFGAIELPEAVRVAHALNGVLFASAAVPVALLARELALPRFAVWSSAAFAVAIPWTVIGAFVMTEAAAYPAALWALLAIQRAVAEPSPRRDGVAVGAVALAAAARPQLVALGLVLAMAALVHELRFRRWREHGLLAAVALVAVLGALLAGTGVLGSYAPALEEGALVSGEVIRSAVVHLDVTAASLGVVPLLLGGGWAIAALARPPEPRRLAFATVVTAAVVVLTLETASVVVRFGLGIVVKDRYLFYVAPLLFLATACALDDPRRRLAGLLAATVFFVLTVGLADFEPVFGVNIDSPASSTNEALTRYAANLGVSAAELVAILGGLVAAVLYFALRLAPRRPLAVAVAFGLVAFALAESAYTWDRLLASSGPSGRPLTESAPSQLSWIDRALPRGSVAALAYSVGQDWWPSAVAWWDLEFWNRRVDRGYLVGPHFTYTPSAFPRTRLRIEPRTGMIAGAEDVEYVVRTTLDARFRPAGPAVAVAPEFEVVAADKPPRAAWLTLGLDRDGWTRAGRRALVRVFPPAGATVLTMTMSAPDVTTPRNVAFGPLSVALASTESREVALEVCVPDGGYADVPIAVDGSTTIRDVATTPPYSRRFREAGVRLSRIQAAPTGRGCQT